MFKIWSGIASVAVLTIIGTLLLPAEYDLTIEAPGKVLPSREWLLIQAEDGALRATLQDHEKGTVEAYTINRFERGDAIRFALNQDIFDRRFLSAGDTVGAIQSSEINIRLTELQGELSARQASLKMFEAGEKPALVEEAKQGVLRAEARANEHSSVLNRLRRLFEQKLIAEEELEAAESLQQIYEADIAIARSQLQARETGARQEQIDLTRAEINALQESVTALQTRLQFQTIISPIDGYIARSFAPDTLLTVRDTAGFLVLIPISWTKLALLEPGLDVEISLPTSDQTISGELLDVGDSIHHINGKQVVPALARIYGYHPQILPGTLVNTTVRCGSVPLNTYLKHRFN